VLLFRRSSVLRSLAFHRLLIAALLAVIAALWFRKGPRQTPNGAEKPVPSPLRRQATGDTSLAETLRKERPEFPIKFDADMNEFQLLHSYTNTVGERLVSRWILYYDPFTGQRLPESTRGSLFETPDAGDLSDLAARLRDVTKLEDVRRILGQPDDVFPANGDIRQQWTYSRLSKTVRVIVQETTNGHMKICYVGQERH
jgi:hypothetical protein